MPKAKERDPGFEESLSALETIVAQLESGDLPLERALELFQEGVGLARRCQSQLEEAERKVEILLRERGEIKTIPFEVPKESQANETEISSVPSTAKTSSIAVVNEELENDEKDKEDFDDKVPF